MLFKDSFLRKRALPWEKKKKKTTIPKEAFFAQWFCLKTCNRSMLLNKDVVQVPARLLGYPAACTGVSIVPNGCRIAMGGDWKSTNTAITPQKQIIAHLLHSGSSIHCPGPGPPSPVRLSKEDRGQRAREGLRGARNALSCYSVPYSGQENKPMMTLTQIY